MEFPGVVPRTFLGPLVVSSISKPLVSLAGTLGAAKPLSQCIGGYTFHYYTTLLPIDIQWRKVFLAVRGVLGVLVCLAFISFRRAVQRTLGPLTSSLLTLITCSQFHFLFYASRPLPNTLALLPALLSLRYWLLGRHAAFLWSSAAAVVLFRAELGGLLGVMVVVEVVRGRCGVWEVVRHALPAGLIWLGQYAWVCLIALHLSIILYSYSHQMCI